MIISTAAQNPSVNVGNLFGLVLHQNGLASHQKNMTYYADIQPDFMTHNTRRTHEVGWQVTIVVAGKSHHVKFYSGSIPTARKVVERSRWDIKLQEKALP